MNVPQLIQTLEAERDRIEKTLAFLRNLEDKHPSLPLKKRRGRKGMNTAQREEVSVRMKRYWAARRKARNGKAEAAIA